MVEERQIDPVACSQPKRVQHEEIARQTDREGRKQDVEGDREGELDARKQYGVETIEHARLRLPPAGGSRARRKASPLC